MFDACGCGRQLRFCRGIKFYIFLHPILLTHLHASNVCCVNGPLAVTLLSELHCNVFKRVQTVPPLVYLTVSPLADVSWRSVVTKQLLVLNWRSPEDTRDDWCYKLFCLNWCQFFLKNGPIPASFSFIFILSLIPIPISTNTNLKKPRWCGWDLNPGPQDCRRRRNNRSMAAALCPLYNTKIFIKLPIKEFTLIGQNWRITLII